MVDCESDGPAVHMYSMVCFGAVLCRDPSQTFFGQTRPITTNFDPEALAISGYTREQHMAFPRIELTMESFLAWATANNEPGTRMTMMSDCSAYDWQWMNYYLWRWCRRNPFGYSCRNLNDLFHGMKKNTQASFKYLRRTPHTHNPIDDAMGNVEALQAMIQMGLQIKL